MRQKRSIFVNETLRTDLLAEWEVLPTGACGIL